MRMGRNSAFHRAHRARAQAFADAREEVVNLNADSFPSTIDQVEEETTPTPAINIGEAYNNWFASTEEGQRSASVGPDLGNPFSLENLGITPEEALANAAERKRKSEEAMALLTPEVRALLESSDFTGSIVPDKGGSMFSGGIFGYGGNSPYSIADMAGGFARENQYKNITQYNPVGTAIEDMVVYDDLNSSEAKAAKAAREREVADSLQEWTQPLKELSKSDPARFTEEYSQLPIDARLAYLRNEYDQGSLTKREYQDAFAEQWNNSEKVEIGVLQHIEKYGYRMNSPDAIAQQGGQDQQGARDWYEADKVFGGDKGEAGDYSYLGSFKPTVKETFDPTSFGRALLSDPIMRGFAALVTGTVSEAAIAIGKGVTGDTLHAEDWINIANGAYNLNTGNAGVLSGSTPAPTGPINPITGLPEAIAETGSTIGGIPVAFTGTPAAIDNDSNATDDAVSDALETVINILDDSGEEVIPTLPPQVETIQELPDAPEAEQEPIEADPIDEVIPQPTLPEVVEEVVEQEEAAEAGGGGEPAP